jgi:hypothetical protein
VPECTGSTMFEPSSGFHRLPLLQRDHPRTASGWRSRPYSRPPIWLVDDLQRAVSVQKLAPLPKIDQAAIAVSSLHETTAAMLEETATLRQVMAEASVEAKRSTAWMSRLTISIAVLTAALVALTYVLVADALGLWPFAGWHRSALSREPG